MTASPVNSLPPQPAAAAASSQKTLRRLFLTLFLRGHTSRGLKKESAPGSVGGKLILTLVLSALFGCVALIFVGQPVFALAVYLHGMTFVYVGMIVASSAGELLFNDSESDILLHRPITPKALLRAKVSILIEVSLWIAGAFNLVGLLVGTFVSNGGLLFPIAHILSVTLETFFCTGCVVMMYELCLRWFGRERLDGLMTTAQIMVSIAAVLGGQLVQRLLIGAQHLAYFDAKTWWIALLPPAWFAGIDDAISGSRATGSWQLAAIAIVATTIVMWLAFDRLARNYATGLQKLAEVVSTPRREGSSGRRRWLDRLADTPPISWWMRDPVARASFVLVGAYLMRDRDVKLRIYPSLAPMLALPLVSMVGIGSNDHPNDTVGALAIAWAGFYLGMIPLFTLYLLQYSHHWQASDIFRAAPMAGPAAILHGARRAVLCLLVFPMLLLFGVLVFFLDHDRSHLLLLLPGIIALPVYALIPNLGGKAIPLSLPTEGAQSARRALTFMLAMLVTMVLAGLVAWAWTNGWFRQAIAFEILDAAGIYYVLRRSYANFRWRSLE